MKKWILFVLAAFFLFIGLLVYRSSSMDLEDYLKLAEELDQESSGDLVLFNLNKALEISIKRYGENSAETAEIYRKLGAADTYYDRAAEYFDKACAVYEEIGMPEKAADVWYQSGVNLAKNRHREEAREALLNAAALYQEYGYENADKLCVAYCYLAVLQEEFEIGLRYYHLAEEAMGGLSEENRTQVTGKIYSGTAETYFGMEQYKEAMTYYRKYFEDQEGAGVEEARLADGYNFAAASLAYMGELDEAGDYLEKAMSAYEAGGGNDYQGISFALVHRALIEGFSENRDGETVMGYGSEALACYTGRTMITSADMNSMGYCRSVMQKVFHTVYPELEDYRFDEWYAANSRLGASVYQMK